MPRFHTLVLCAALAIPALAMAQAPDSGTGFFRPTPGNDPSLNRTLPPQDYAGTVPNPAPARVAPVAPPAAPVATVEPEPAPAAERAAAAEAQMDRSQAEARQAQENAMRAPPRINGAFTGLTDERDR